MNTTMIIPEIPEIMQDATGNLAITKQIGLQTNYNNKMGCNAFLHITVAPTNRPSRQEVEKMVIEISTKDGSHPPVIKKIYDIMFMSLEKLPCCFTMASHGIDDKAFVDFMFLKYPDYLSRNDEVAIYFYVPV